MDTAMGLECPLETARCGPIRHNHSRHSYDIYGGYLTDEDDM